MNHMAFEHKIPTAQCHLFRVVWVKGALLWDGDRCVAFSN